MHGVPENSKSTSKMLYHSLKTKTNSERRNLVFNEHFDSIGEAKIGRVSGARRKDDLCRIEKRV